MTFAIKDANHLTIAVLDVPDADGTLEELVSKEAMDADRWTAVDPELGEIVAIGTLILFGYDVKVPFGPMDAMEGKTADVPADAKTFILPAPFDPARLRAGAADAD